MRTGTPTGTVYTSPRRKQARARCRRREEAEWAARSGPVTVTYREILPSDREILPKSAATDCDGNSQSCSRALV